MMNIISVSPIVFWMARKKFQFKHNFLKNIHEISKGWKNVIPEMLDLRKWWILIAPLGEKRLSKAWKINDEKSY